MCCTVLASFSLTSNLRSRTSYPIGTVPPIQIPLRLEAATLSRMRSPITSRSNCANDSRTLRVSLPIEVVVLNCWVTATNDTSWVSNNSTILAKSASDRVRRSTCAEFACDRLGWHHLRRLEHDYVCRQPLRDPLR